MAAPVIGAVSLRPYQREALDAVRKLRDEGARRMLLVAATGAGKTVTFSHLGDALGLGPAEKILILAHRDELVQQARAKYLASNPSELVGIEKAENRATPMDRVAVASVQTLRGKRIADFLARFGRPSLVITDECFPAGTLVDGRPIESYQPGDRVTAYDEQTGQLVESFVVRTFERESESLVCVHAAGRSVTCTGNHPFLTQRGWIAAEYLSQNDVLFRVLNDVCQHEKMATGCDQGRGTSLLPTGVREDLRRPVIVGADGSNEPEVRVGAHDAQESDGRSSRARADVANAQGDRSQAFDSRGQRERSYATAGAVAQSLGSGMDRGARDPNGLQRSGGERHGAIAVALQDRSGVSARDDRGGSRRSFSRSSQRSRSGREKERVLDIARVDRVEVLEPRDRDGHRIRTRVYNLEVADQHTYVAEGFVVHNCHHSASKSYQAVYNALGIVKGGSVVHVGVTATPKRTDGIGLDGTFDVIAHSIGIDELIDQGYLVPLRGYVVHTSTNLDAVRTTAGDFNAGELSDAVDNDERNARIVSAFSDLCPGRKAIVFAASVQHSIDLRDAFRAVGFKAVHVDGGMPMDERRAVLQEFGSGKAQILTNCQVATEGYDEPSVDCVIIARPTKSPVLMVQMVGRCTRLYPGKKDAVVIDMVDVTRRHSVVTLPSLFGMPGNFDLQGNSVTAIAKKYRDVVSESPEMAGLLGSAGDLDASASVTASQRFHARLKALIDRARASQEYVDVNLLRPPDLPAETAAKTNLNWVPTADDSYLLRVDQDTVRIHADLLGEHSVTITRKKDGATLQRELGKFGLAEDAFSVADDWVRRNHAERMVLVDRSARWREAPASEKQVLALQRFRIANPEKLTRGKAAELLDVLIASSPRRKTA